MDGQFAQASQEVATIHRLDSFDGDMTTTTKSVGMNNVFTKTFHQKLSISEFIEAHDKCMACLHRKEKYEDFKSVVQLAEPLQFVS